MAKQNLDELTRVPWIPSNPTTVTQAAANYAWSMENAIRVLGGAAYWIERAAEKGMPDSLDGTDADHEWCAEKAKKVREVLKAANLAYFGREGVTLA